jgi:hypothetical protein
MKTYIYGETFIKTRKNLYCIKSYNIGLSDKIENNYYIAVKSFSTQKGKTNCFTFCDGNKHITAYEEKENPLFNGIKENSKLFKALKKRYNLL